MGFKLYVELINQRPPSQIKTLYVIRMQYFCMAKTLTKVTDPSLIKMKKIQKILDSVKSVDQPVFYLWSTQELCDRVEKIKIAMRNRNNSLMYLPVWPTGYSFCKKNGKPMYLGLTGTQRFERSRYSRGQDTENVDLWNKIAWMRDVPGKQSKTQNISAEGRELEEVKGLRIFGSSAEMGISVRDGRVGRLCKHGP